MDTSRTEGQYLHEEALQAALLDMFTGDHADLTDFCADAGLPAPHSPDEQPVVIDEAHSYRDAGLLSTDRGVVLDLSDGSQFQLTITMSRRPQPAPGTGSRPA
jgi:hypothetical protein